MSYCRVGEDSDVYVWCGAKFEVCFAEGVLDVAKRMVETGVVSKSFETEKETLEYLERARKLGFKVPDYATERLKKEIDMPNYYDQIVEQWFAEAEKNYPE